MIEGKNSIMKIVFNGIRLESLTKFETAYKKALKTN